MEAGVGDRVGKGAMGWVLGNKWRECENSVEKLLFCILPCFWGVRPLLGRQKAEVLASFSLLHQIVGLVGCQHGAQGRQNVA